MDMKIEIMRFVCAFYQLVGHPSHIQRPKIASWKEKNENSNMTKKETIILTAIACE
jgi:hypothetical protein